VVREGLSRRAGTNSAASASPGGQCGKFERSYRCELTMYPDVRYRRIAEMLFASLDNLTRTILHDKMPHESGTQE
jgi:hypothetical protein